MAAVLEALQAGIIPRNTTKRIKKELNADMKKGFSPLGLINLLKKNIPDTILYTPSNAQSNASLAKREVILSAYLQPE